MNKFQNRCRLAIAGFLVALLGPIDAVAAAEPADGALVKFDVLEYDVEGNSVLSDIEIERAVTPFLGEQKTLRDVDGAREALEKTYHEAGYLTAVVSIPEQKVDEGNVRLSVVEGRIDRLRIKGAEYHPSSDIRRQLPELAQGGVPYFPKVQRDLDALNRSADLKATPVLKAGRTPGTVDIDLEVEDQLPLHGNIELNDRQTPGTHPLRLNAAVRYDNLWAAGHSVGLTAQTAPQATEQLKVLAGNYVLPVGDAGNALALYAVHSESNVPGPTSVLNNSDIGGLRLVLPLPPADSYSHSANLGFDYKNIHPVKAVVGSSASTTLQPAITYVPLVAAYSGGWMHSGGSTAVDGTLTLGLRGLFGNRESEFDAKRPGASAQYAVLRTGLSHSRTIGHWTLSGRLDAQGASGLLLPNEQYAAGGSDTVRGYLESEQTADRAARVSLEVRTPSLRLGDEESSPLRLAGVGFYDAARLSVLQYDPTRSTMLAPLRYTLRGAGVGLRLSGPRGVSLNLDVARALSDGGAGSNNTRAGDYRIHSRLVWEFL